MNRIEEVFYSVTKRHIPSAKKVELNTKPQTLSVFFDLKNEFGITETKVIGLLRIYSLIGEEKFDGLLSDLEELYKLLSLKGDPSNLDVKFFFV